MAAIETDAPEASAILLALPPLLLISWRLFSPQFVFAPQAILYLDAARRVLAGEKLYTDFWDLCQPALLALYSVPQWLSAFCDLALTTKLLVWLLLVASLTATMFIVRVKPTNAVAPVSSPALALAICCANLAVCSQFGTVQHLFMLLLTPWLVLRIVTCEGVRSPVHIALVMLAAAAAALGCALDLPYLAVLLFCECFLLLRYGAIKVRQLFIFAMALALIFLFTILMDISIWQGYFQWAMPLRLAKFSYFDGGLLGTTFPNHSNFLYFFAVVLLAAYYSGNRAQSSLRSLFAVLALSGLALFIAEGDGLSYHIVIAVYGIVFLLVLSLISLLKQTWQTASAAIVLPLAIVAITAIPQAPADLLASQTIDNAILNLSEEGEQITVIAQYPDVAYSRISALQRLPGSYLLNAMPLRLLHDLQLGQPLNDKQFSCQAFLVAKITENLASRKATLVLLEAPRQSELLRIYGLSKVLLDNYSPAGHCQAFAEPYGTTQFSVWRRK